MSFLNELSDKLTGVQATNVKLNMLNERVEKMTGIFIEHAKRLIKLETLFNLLANMIKTKEDK